MKKDIKYLIKEYLKQNKISTTEVSDALGKSGVSKNIIPINQGLYKVGSIKCIFTANKSNYQLHEEITFIKDGDLPFIFTENCDGKAVLGELVAKYLCLYKNCPAVIVDGFVRDIASLKKENYPIWCKGFTPLGCINQPTKLFNTSRANAIKEEHENGIVICDDGGVVVIKNNEINHDLLNKLKNIELLEDLWFFCLDTLKWSTKEIVCDKKYLKEKENIPSIFKNLLVPEDKG